MICLRCGYCCRSYCVVIVDDPDKGIQEGNLIVWNPEQDGPCKHLKGDKPGEYSCEIHTKPWYKETPCFEYGQIETNSNCECRLGRYIMDKSTKRSDK